MKNKFLVPFLIFLLILPTYAIQVQTASAATSSQNQLLETISVPSDGSQVKSKTILASSITYQIVASGEVTVGGPGYGDAEYAYSINPPIDHGGTPWDGGIINNCGNTSSGVDLGIGIDNTVNSNSKSPNWGAFTDTHTYTINLQGKGAPITLNYHDCNYNDNSGSLTVKVYGPQTVTPPVNPSIKDFSFSPSVAHPGDIVTATIIVNNPNLSPVNIGLGMSIRPVGGAGISDGAHDIQVQAKPGTNSYQRQFLIPSQASLGNYEVGVGLWSGQPGSSTGISFPPWKSGLTIQSVTPQITLPSAPTNLHATLTSPTTMNLSWNPPANNGGSHALSYKVEVKTGALNNYQIIIGAYPQTSYTYTYSFTPGTTYTFRVSAMNEAGTGPPSNQVPVAIAPLQPQYPTPTGADIVATQGSATNQNCGLTCFNPSQYTTTVGNTVTFGNDDSFNHVFSSGNPTDSQTGTEFYSDIVQPGHTFSHTFNNAGSYPFFDSTHPWMTGTIKVLTPSITTPGPPTGLTAKLASPTSISLSWSPAQDNGGSQITNYKIYRSTSSGTEVLLTTTGNVLAYTDTHVSPGTTYYYKVLAVNVAGIGKASDEAIIKVTSTPPIPPISNVLTVQTASPLYNPGDLVTVLISSSLPISQEVEITVYDSQVNEILDSLVATDDNGDGFLQFSLSDNSIGGEYQVYATPYTPGDEGGSTTFTVSSIYFGTTENGQSQVTNSEQNNTFSTTVTIVNNVAQTTLPSGITSSLTFLNTQLGSVKFEKTQVTNDKTYDGKSIKFVGDVVDIQPAGGASCINGCIVSFEFNQNQIPLGFASTDMKIFHDKNNDGDFNDIGETLDTKITQVSTNVYKASATDFFNSKFAVGGIAIITSLSNLGVSTVQSTLPSNDQNLQSSQVKILSLHASDQNGNPVDFFKKGSVNYAKVVMSSQTSSRILLTINVFDSSLETIGLGSLKTTINGNLETVVSFFVPSESQSGSSKIYVDTLTDWTTNNGVPLTTEQESDVEIR